MSSTTFRLSLDVTVNVDDYATNYGVEDTGEVYEMVAHDVIGAAAEHFRGTGIRASVSHADLSAEPPRTYNVRMQYRNAVGVHNVTVQVQADDRTSATFKAQTELNRTHGVFRPDSLAVTEVEK